VFTGIIEELGEVVRLDHNGDAAEIVVAASFDDVQPGDSVAVNGVCLTATVLAGGTVTMDVMQETLKRSSIGTLHRGDRVNLERAVRADSRLGGHIVQGHVDDIGVIVSREPGSNWSQVRISAPDSLLRYVVEKGSVAVDGISLTVSATGGGWFEVCLIPETLSRTTLGFRQPGDVVNLEADVIAKYVEGLMAR
jgi:riboflavin synthase